MLGGSLIKSVAAAKAGHYNVSFVSIDPYTGDVNMIIWEHGAFKSGVWRFLRNENGRGRIYDRFLANVKAAGHDDAVVPICASAIVGLRVIRVLVEEKRLRTLPQVIYLDSAHEADETMLELVTAWNVLESGGILFGDDWGWGTVRGDVERFAKLKQPVVDTVKLRSLQQLLTGSTIDAFGVLLHEGQWILAKQ